MRKICFLWYSSTSNSFIQSTRIPIDDIISFIREHIDHIDSMDIVVSGEQQKQLISGMNLNIIVMESVLLLLFRS